MAIRSIIGLTLILAGCTIEGTPTSEPIAPTRTWDTFTTNVVVMSKNKIQNHCANLGVPYRANGCARIDLVTKNCTVYVPTIINMDDDAAFQVWGHELAHCTYGQFHK